MQLPFDFEERESSKEEDRGSSKEERDWSRDGRN